MKTVGGVVSNVGFEVEDGIDVAAGIRLREYGTPTFIRRAAKINKAAVQPAEIVVPPEFHGAGYLAKATRVANLIDAVRVAVEGILHLLCSLDTVLRSDVHAPDIGLVANPETRGPRH